MGQDQSSPQSTFEHISLKIQHHTSLQHRQNYSSFDKKHQMCNCQARKSLSVRKQKKHKIFEESLPLSLPLVSKNKIILNPVLNQQEINNPQPQKKENRYFSQSMLKSSLYIYEDNKSKVRTRRQKRQIADENQNPNGINQCVAIDQKDSENKKQFRKTLGGLPTKRGYSWDPFQSKQFELLTKQQKITSNFTRMNHSIINQWFQMSQIEQKCKSDKQDKLKMRNNSKKIKIAKIQKASGIFSKKNQKSNRSQKRVLSDTNALVNITNVALLQSRDN